MQPPAKQTCHNNWHCVKEQKFAVNHTSQDPQTRTLITKWQTIFQTSTKTFAILGMTILSSPHFIQPLDFLPGKRLTSYWDKSGKENPQSRNASLKSQISTHHDAASLQFHLASLCFPPEMWREARHHGHPPKQGVHSNL